MVRYCHFIYFLSDTSWEALSKYLANIFFAFWDAYETWSGTTLG